MSHASGERIKSLRLELGLTQGQLAALVDTSVKAQNISYYEQGREPSFDVLIKLARALNTSCEYIITGVNANQQDVHNAVCLSGTAIRRLSTLPQNSDIIHLINALLETDDKTLLALAVQFSIYCNVCYMISHEKVLIKYDISDNVNEPVWFKDKNDSLVNGIAENCKKAFTSFLAWSKDNCQRYAGPTGQTEIPLDNAEKEDAGNARHD